MFSNVNVVRGLKLIPTNFFNAAVVSINPLQ